MLVFDSREAYPVSSHAHCGVLEKTDGLAAVAPEIAGSLLSTPYRADETMLLPT